MSARAAAAVLLCLAALLAGGCGGDDEKSSADGTATQTTSTPDTAATDTATTPTPKRVTTPTETAGDNGGTTSPEKQPGGAGDEVPNSTQALVTGRSGKLAPAKVSVPPFIAVTVELRSGDGLDYALRGGGKSLGAGEGHNSASATFDGLRPGKSLVLSGPQGRVVISADADPGP